MLENMAGATGLEPATSGVTGRRLSRFYNARFDSGRANSGPKPAGFDSRRRRVETLAIVVLLIFSSGAPAPIDANGNAVVLR